MKVAIDLRPLQIGHQNRGIGAYLLNILDNFPRDDSVEYIFLRYDTSNPIAEFNIGDQRIYREITFKKFSFSPRPVQALKFIYGLLLPKFLPLYHHQPDVFFQTDYLLGVPSRLLVKKRVTTCYDIIPLKFPAMYLPSWTRFANMRHLRLRSRVRQSIRAIYYARKYKKGVHSLKQSETILSISKCTTNDLASIGIPKSKIQTIYLAPSYRQANIPDHENTGSANPFLFYVGGGDKRRQVDYLISAFNKLNGRGHQIDLVLAGNEFAEDSKEMRYDIREAIQKSSYKKQITLAGAISEEEKLRYMRACKAFVYPSLYEGFGMPVVEAMVVETPVISYKNSSIHEIAQDGIIYAKESSDGIFDAVRSLVVMSESDIKKLTAAAKSRTDNLSWTTTAKQTWDALVD